ncbi:MAG TPA: serine/threonine-protein kinase, partial [Oligoflexia bacterium]|nr:serine/threonine-protein kinase [Oligoflexia bacterium]
MDTNFIGKYEIVSTLGRGSMGVVYKGRDPEIGRLVAIKTLKSMFMGNDPAGNEALQRFRQEARSAGRLHHPNIVTIFEAGRTDNGSPYIAMEYIEGTSLEARIAEQGPLDPLAALHYLAQIASAIDYAHMQNVIHRDIKPSNVLIDGAQRSHLLDFGVAKMSDTSLTPAGTVVGTPS